MRWRLARTAASTDESLTARSPTKTKPSGEGVIDTLAPELTVIPFVTGDENAVFNLRILLWAEVLIVGGSTWYLPVILTSAPYFVCTIGAGVGPTGGTHINETNKFCDTITCSDASVTSQSELVRIASPEGDLIANISQATGGFAIAEILFGISSGTITGMNALVSGG